MVVDNVRPMLIQSTNGNLHFDDPTIPWHCFVFQLLFFQKTIPTSLLHKEGGGGGVFYILLNREAPSQGPTCSNCIPFLNP